MKASLVRMIAAVLMILCLALLISSPALAEVTPLPLDQTVPGNPAKPEGWSSETDYQDESITVTTEFRTVYAEKCRKEIPSVVVRVKIADPTQIRTAMSYDSYDKGGYVQASLMAEHVNAIAACNGDFFKYHYQIGYVVRQGVEYRLNLIGSRDVLIIDDLGNFHGVYAATEEGVAEYVAQLQAQGRKVINSFTLGPILVDHGEIPDINDEHWEFSMRDSAQRIAIVQLGEKEYAIIEVDGMVGNEKAKSYGMTIKEFAAYVHEVFPDAIMAYNLDGGGSTNVIVNGERIHANPDRRNICDIIYFASAAGEE
ncbi:MAG: phosphodiester glycosidase family protein [Clostridia bacterium]|nr:phosphodiester glycosidase family protein [Clostridia bacterium]